MVSTRVAIATEGAAPKSPAKLFGFRMSPKIANKETAKPPIKNRNRYCNVPSPAQRDGQRVKGRVPRPGPLNRRSSDKSLGLANPVYYASWTWNDLIRKRVSQV